MVAARGAMVAALHTIRAYRTLLCPQSVAEK